MTIRLALPIIAVLTAAAAPAALAGTWMVESIDGKAPRYSGASVEFGSRSVQATAGCNAMSGTYSISDGKLIAPPLIQTLMACENLMEDESIMGTVLGGSPTIERNADKLILKTARHSLTLRLRR